MLKSSAIAILWIIAIQSVSIAQTNESSMSSLLSLQQKLNVSRYLMVPADDKSVANDLELSKEQLISLAELREEVRLGAQDFHLGRNRDEVEKQRAEFVRTMDEKLKAVLNERQSLRLDQLALQQDGARALSRPDIILKLGITAAQQLRMRDASQDAQQIPFDARNPQAARNIPDLRPSQKEIGYAYYEILSERQRTIWKEMIGEPMPLLRILAPLAPRETPAPPKVRFPQSPMVASYTRLKNPILKAELQLTDEQMANLAEADAVIQSFQIDRNPAAPRPDLEELRNRSALVKERLKAIEDYQARYSQVLSEIQRTRIEEIEFRRTAELSVMRREFRDAANLTDDQINAIDQLTRDRQSAAVAPKRTTLQTEEQRKAAVVYSQETLTLALKLLSDDQRQIWEKMAGKPVAMEALYDVPPKPAQ